VKGLGGREEVKGFFHRARELRRYDDLSSKKPRGSMFILLQKHSAGELLSMTQTK